MLHPLDALYFAELKKEIRKNISEYEINKQWDIIKVLASPFYRANDPKTIRNSFKHCGIYPPAFVNEKYFIGETTKALSTILDRSNTENKNNNSSNIQFSNSDVITPSSPINISSPLICSFSPSTREALFTFKNMTQEKAKKASKPRFTSNLLFIIFNVNKY